MGLSRTVAAFAAIAVAAAGRGAVSAAEPGPVTFAAEDGVVTLPFENVGSSDRACGRGSASFSTMRGGA
jgi:hypothetical protein